MKCNNCGEETEYIDSYDNVNDWIIDEYKCPHCGHYQKSGDYYS